MEHLHKYIYLEKNGEVLVSLDEPANVYLMNHDSYKLYLAGEAFESFGGAAKKGKAKMAAPSAGEWHLVIDSGGRSVNVSMQLENGSIIPRDWQADAEREVAEPADPKDLEKKRKEVIKEITKQLKDVNMEGLLFLRKQIAVLLHNQQVEKINQEIDELNASAQIEAKKSAKKGKKGSAPAPEKPSYSVDIQEGGGDSFFLVINNARKILARDELRKIVAICHENISGKEYEERMFKWLKSNRSDILMDGKIGSGSALFYKTLRELIKSRYKVKK